MPGSLAWADRVGIMGGFGPLAGAHFYRRLIELTPAGDDGEHVPVVLMTNPATPSRLAHLYGDGPSPVPALVHLAQELARSGATVLAIPSATVHAYYAEIQAAVGIPVLHLPQVAMAAVRARGVKRLALLATTPTLSLQLYRQPAEEAGISVLVPDGATQDEVMTVITRVKAGGFPTEPAERLGALTARPWAAKADAFLLGCTELPAVYPPALRPAGTFDATDELVRAVLRYVGRLP